MEEEKRAEEHVTHIEHHKHSFTDKARNNPWIISTLVFGGLAIVLLVSTFYGGFTGNAISAKSAGEKILTYYTSMGVEGITLDSINEVSGLYEVNLLYKGQAIPIYVTKDGKSFTESLSPTTETASNSETTQEEVPKTDKPSVELYVFTYCPYGTQMEKAMIPAVKLLGDKIDFKIRQIGAMHGEYEKIEAERQLCIEKNYPTKFLDYVLSFAESTEIGSCSQGETTCLTPKLTALYSKLGIDGAKINSCMASEGEELYNEEVANSKAKGISGSPGLLINGVQSSVSRSPEAVKGVICSAFNTVPSECSTTLSTSQAAAGFGTGTSSGSASAASC
jgi:hypothetical protein